MQISNISFHHPLYPIWLKEIPQPPKTLHVLGEIPTGPAVAVVGSRKATDYGKRITYDICAELSRAGVVIISGLAHGIDAIAHRAAVENGGQTIAVLAHGLDEIYPAENRPLARRILASRGALISEYPIKTPPLKQHFPARNRIVSGLSLATIITEADASSGSLITANFALEQNRQVMAVPGNITSPRSAGPNNLLKAGATPITCASDILAALDLSSTAIAPLPIKADSREEAIILDLLQNGRYKTEQLLEASELSASQFASLMSLMEITGKVRSLGAGNWARR